MAEHISIPIFHDAAERPPIGGWQYPFDPVSKVRTARGHSPDEVFQQVKAYRLNNGQFRSEQELWAEMWAYWCEKEPKRCSASKEMPPLTVLVKNAAGAVIRTAAGILSGDTVVADEDLKAHRLEICLQCNEYNEAAKRCSRCGCFTGLKTKLFNERCPLGKW